MKASIKFILTLLLFLVVSLVFFAQVTAKAGRNYNLQPQTGDMMPGAMMPLHFSDKDPGNINTEIEYPVVVKRFRKLFPGAIKESWYKVGKNLFVYFFHLGNKVTAVFTLRGHMNYAIANLQITDLPGTIINKIESLYQGYGLFNVKQIMEDNHSIYEIVLVNSCEYIVINVSEGEITERKRIRKS